MQCEACSASVPAGDRCCPSCGTATPLPASAEAETLATGQPDAADTQPSGDESPATQVFDSEHFSKVADVRTGRVARLKIGSVLGGRYEILSQLGEGGMGAVYKAKDREVERLVALKIIRPELAGNESILRRFRQELVITRQITHRNVVRIFDIGVLDGVRFISMEYIDGQELAGLLKDRSKLPPVEAASIMLQVCQGLEVAHREGTVHRDLKPQNVMIDRQGRVAVMDFGIAHLAGTAAIPADGEASASGPAHLTRVGALMGTPRYMSPEQVASEPTDQRSDIFTVGVMLFELVSGQIPTAATLKEHFQARKTQPFPDLREAEPDAPQALCDIVAKCVRLQPADRYQSVPEVIEDLELFLGIRKPAVPIRPARRWPLAAAISLAAVAILLLIYERSRPAGPVRHAPVNLLVADFKNTTGNPVLTATLEPIFSTALEGASFITTFNRGQAKRIATTIGSGATLDEKAAQLVARREGIGVLISGAVQPDGRGYVFSAKAADAGNGKAIDEESAYASDAKALPAAVNKVAAKIRRALGDTTPQAVQLAAAETFSSASLEASQKYAQGQEAQWNGQWNQALELWQQSIAIDPNLGRAYAGMAATLANMGRRQDAERMYKLAMGKLNRMSEREKLRTRGGYFLLERNYSKAIEQFRQLTNEFPADTAGAANLALAYFYQRDMPAALQTGQAALALHPNNLLQLNNVGLFAMYSSDFPLAIRESERLLKLNPAFEKGYVCLGLSQLASGDRDGALATYQKLSGLSPSGASEAVVGLADLALFEGRFADAVQLLEAGLKTDLASKDNSPAAQKWILLSEALFNSGKQDKALAAAGRAVTDTSDESILYPAALLYLRAGNDAKAEALADQLSRRFDPDSIAYGKLIIAEQLLSRGKLREAIDQFAEARKTSDTWAGHLGLARAYVQAGLYAEGDAEADLLVKRRGEAAALFLNDEPSYRYFAPVYYYQGRAKQGLQTPDAAEAYKNFVNPRRNSREPLVLDAGRRLAALK